VFKREQITGRVVSHQAYKLPAPEFSPLPIIFFSSRPCLRLWPLRDLKDTKALI